MKKGGWPATKTFCRSGASTSPPSMGKIIVRHVVHVYSYIGFRQKGRASDKPALQKVLVAGLRREEEIQNAKRRGGPGLDIFRSPRLACLRHPCAKLFLDFVSMY